MSLGRNIAIFTITVSLLTFIAFFGRLPAFRYTPVGFLHRLLIVHIPSTLRRTDLFLTNGRVTNGGLRFGHYLLHEKHPLVMVFFLGLVTACAVLFLPVIWEQISLHHKLLVLILLPLPYLFTYLSATRNADAYITPQNHAAQMRHYPYDRILYYPGIICETCKLLKPARSKHCSICKTCVARMDHHCVWVNNCLGRGNYRWFLALLLSSTLLIAYGAYLAYMVISPLAEQQYKTYEQWYKYKPPRGSDPNSWTTYKDTKWHNLSTMASIYLDIGGLRASGVGMLCLIAWTLPLGLLLYHVYLIYAGMSTNENMKWGDWRDDMADGNVFLAHRRPETMRDDLSSDSLHDVKPPATFGNSICSALGSSPSTSASSIPTPPGTPPNEEEPLTTWPLESKHILLRTYTGEAPRNLPDLIKSVTDEESFQRVWHLGVVENVYDLGFWDNFVEAMR
ncbi:palmitoyltransferase swf1 [Lophiostoma macrostomum CBS 122681]|uniref:Palmitoyltransferase n=1 Tax=Lophiostoma macrostomum CBS 122681 TaxID=1314788 RepID=A0A6A6T4A3_9PLEO|nr:palmitoyltransferase swf1 [Lophiostoma macrostomum CBS 122681]